MPDLKAISRDPAAFRRAVLIDTDAGPRPLAEVADPWQTADFEALDTAWCRLAGVKTAGRVRARAYLERPRGHSKTADLACMATWAIAFGRRRLSLVAAAADRDQARLLRDAVSRLVSANPWLTLLDVQAGRVVNRRSESTLEILSSDAASSYGLTPDAVLCDELCHWGSRELWDSLLSAAAKRANCLLVVISNAGFGDSWQHETREKIRTDPAWYFSRLDGPQASWITAERLAEQRRLLPDVAYRRLWLNEWTSGSGDALSDEAIDRALVLPGPTPTPADEWLHVAGLDLGLRRDATGLCVVALHVGKSEVVERKPPPVPLAVRALRELGWFDEPIVEEEILLQEARGTIRLTDVRLFRAGDRREVEVTEIEQSLFALQEKHQLGAVFFDPHQLIAKAQDWRRRGLPMQEVAFTPANLGAMASLTLEAFREGRIELFPNDDLLADLRSMRIEEKSYGLRLSFPRDGRGHGDLGQSLLLAIYGANQIATFGNCAVSDPLVTYP